MVLRLRALASKLYYLSSDSGVCMVDQKNQFWQRWGGGFLACVVVCIEMAQCREMPVWGGVGG